MMDAVRAYLLRLAAGAFFTALVLAAVPKGNARRTASLVCGLVMLLLALTPLTGIDTGALASAIGALELQQEQARTGVEVQNRELVAQIISARTESYILDKAASLGLSIAVTVETAANGATPFPYAVTYTGDAAMAQRRALERYVDETFAIPAERQVWTP